MSSCSYCGAMSTEKKGVLCLDASTCIERREALDMAGKKGKGNTAAVVEDVLAEERLELTIALLKITIAEVMRYDGAVGWPTVAIVGRAVGIADAAASAIYPPPAKQDPED